MIGRGEYEGKIVPKVEMNCIKWNFAVFFFSLVCARQRPLRATSIWADNEILSGS